MPTGYLNWGNNAAQCHRSDNGLVFLLQFSDLRSRRRARFRGLRTKKLIVRFFSPQRGFQDES